MEEFVWVALKSKDRYGTSAIEVDGLEYEEAKERDQLARNEQDRRGQGPGSSHEQCGEQTL